MRDFRDSKGMAKTLREALSAKTIDISHSDSLELIAKAFGLTDWNTLAAKIAAERSGPEPLALPAKPALSTTIIRPFIPAGKDYEASKAFYAALGFTMTFDQGVVSGWSCDSGWFLLLKDERPLEWGESFLMQLGVDDLDAWWAHIQTLDLPARFGVKAATPPVLEPWGMRIAYLTGPSGECWHITQA